KSEGLLPPNHYLSVCIHYLFGNREKWQKTVAVGKTVVSSSMIDRVASKAGRRLYEVPVGFKWFVEGLLAGWLGFAGEESAGASFLRRDGSVWTTDKDGIIASLLSAEIVARLGRDPGQIYTGLTREMGDPLYERIDAPATPQQKSILEKLSPGDGSPIGGIKVTTQNGWFAARPSGTEDIYKIYAESFLGQTHLRQMETEAQTIVNETLARSAGAAAGS